MKNIHKRMLSAGVVLLCMLVANVARAGVVTIPNSFTSGTPAVAAEVNDNFAAVKTAVDDNDSRIAALESAIATLQATVATLQSQIATVNASNVMALESYLSVDAVSDPRGPLVRFTGANVQVVNGLGGTATSNGLGNLIVGYDEADISATLRCTVGWYSVGGVPTNPSNCATAGGIWTSAGFKTGSHYLVTGSEHNYSKWGGILAGYRNTVNYNYASVSGGYYNTASGMSASVSGGNSNTASGSDASVSGGYGNIASGSSASVSGGNYNNSSGMYASVSGGASVTASGDYASVSGGAYNTASGWGASISGGYRNIASGLSASVSGGGNGAQTGGGNTAATSYSSILGGTGQTTTTVSQTIPALP